MDAGRPLITLQPFVLGMILSENPQARPPQAGAGIFRDHALSLVEQHGLRLPTGGKGDGR